MKKSKSKLWIAGIVVIIAAAAFFALQATVKSRTSQTIAAQTASVTRGSLAVTLQRTGVVDAEPSAALGWESNGFVSAYDLIVGDKVEKGDVLLTLEDNSKSAEILQAQTSLLEAQAELDKQTIADTAYQDALKEVRYQEIILINRYSQRHEFYGTDISDERVEGIRASYDSARQDVWTLEADYEKVRKLDEKDPQRMAAYDALQSGILKRDSLLRAFSQILGTPYGFRVETFFNAYDEQEAVVAEARAAYERYVDDSDEISAARAKVQMLQNTINMASIIAPFSGTVTAINAVAGEYAAAGDVAVQLDDLSNLVINIEISQININSIYIGQPVTITFSALPNLTYSGTVTGFSAAGTDENLFNVRVSMDNADEMVKPGFTVNADIITYQADDVLLAPNTAVQYDTDGSAYVMAADFAGAYNKITVETGGHSDAFTEIKSETIKEGDILAVNLVEGSPFMAGPNQMNFAARRLRSGN